MPIKVLIVDDSALVRKLLTEIISREPDFVVVGAARDPYEAREMIKELLPDVLTLDVEMPRMDGLTFLGNLMRLRPMPVLMVSSLTERGADVTMAALEAGAIDFVTKPQAGLHDGLAVLARELCEKLRSAAAANVLTRREQRPVPSRVHAKSTQLSTTDRVIAIGASTGGTEAVAAILHEMPPDAPAIVITQHIPELFSARFAQRLDAECEIRVSEAQGGEQLMLGHAYVARGNHHLRVKRSGAKYFCEVGQEAAVNRHRPSVHVLFESTALAAGHNAIGVILTGMGDDGAHGLKLMREAGSPTLAQDRATSVVWGMPGEAVKCGAAQEVLPLERIAGRILELARR
ncbi:MAG TPA: chemotaxis response regulator protein-glutamate methylesterase [Polyangiaceae bacterium]|nr:chemotaxis response regulator protein-glutamate methylesterase [Polyangiaceae bacterium]